MPGRTTKRYSNIQEKRLAKNLHGGDKQLASGALPIASKKGDVRAIATSDWKLLVDGKTTMNDTHQAGVRSKTLHKDELQKVEQQAREGGYNIGVLATSFDNKTDYYVVKDIDFNNMYNALIDYESLVEQLRAEVKTLNEKLAAQQKADIKPRFAEIQLDG